MMRCARRRARAFLRFAALACLLLSGAGCVERSPGGEGPFLWEPAGDSADALVPGESGAGEGEDPPPPERALPPRPPGLPWPWEQSELRYLVRSNATRGGVEAALQEEFAFTILIGEWRGWYRGAWRGTSPDGRPVLGEATRALAGAPPVAPRGAEVGAGLPAEALVYFRDGEVRLAPRLTAVEEENVSVRVNGRDGNWSLVRFEGVFEGGGSASFWVDPATGAVPKFEVREGTGERAWTVGVWTDAPLGVFSALPLSPPPSATPGVGGPSAPGEDRARDLEDSEDAGRVEIPPRRASRPR